MFNRLLLTLIHIIALICFISGLAALIITFINIVDLPFPYSITIISAIAMITLSMALIIVTHNNNKIIETLQHNNDLNSQKALRISLRGDMIRELAKIASFIDTLFAVLASRKIGYLPIHLSKQLITEAKNAELAFTYLEYLQNDMNIFGELLSKHISELLIQYNTNFKVITKLAYNYNNIGTLFNHISGSKPEALEKMHKDIHNLKATIDVISIALTTDYLV